MNKIVKTLFIVLAVLLVAVLILKTLGFVGKVTGSILLLPFHLIGGLIGLVFGLVMGVFGLIMGLLGMVIGLGVLLIPVLLVIGFIVFMVWMLGFVFKGSGRKDRPFEPTEARTREDIRSGIKRMEKRIQSLETILTRQDAP